MKELLDKMREAVTYTDTRDNEQQSIHDECLKYLAHIVREYDYENHEVLQVWKKDIRADERERCMDAIYKCENLTPAQQYFAIEAIKAE